MKKNPSCIVLLSGGQDSTTCFFWAKKYYETIQAVGFHYGQKHAKELEFANNICKTHNTPYHIFELKDLLSDSSLLIKSEENNHNDSHPSDKTLPNSFVPGRNALFFTIAATYGYTQKIYHLISGICETDYSGYPDCRASFVQSQANTLSLALNIPIQIITPLMYLTKAETWKLAKDLNTSTCNVLEIIRNQTISDYNGDTTPNEWGMGQLDNPASLLRAKGYQEAQEKGWI